ncbi:MAG: FecR family protein, partial [Bacteriovoracaceae bacterium]
MKKTMSASLILCLLFQTSSALAAPSAKVVMTRGEVTKLKPGERDASPVKRGEVLPEDTSVLTGEKSVVRLRFADNSTMNLGPKSKVVISKMPEQKPNMINLLTGAIKAEVDKKENEKKKTKMIIKTRSAVMGVRGTKFQAVYNAQNKNTSLVTIEGKVAMVKKEKPVLKSAQDLTAEGPARVADSDAELDAFDKSLQESKEAVEVDAGKYSGVQESAQAPSQPVKIAPKQYEAMAKSMNSKNTAEEVMGTEDALGEIEALESAPKPGGFVDFETAIYVPPSEEALLDNETATFTAEEDMGDVDQATGDYIPPKGVKLDAKEGFVVDQEEIAKVASNEEKEEMQRTLAKMESVNKDVKKQVAASANKIEKKVEASRPWYRPDTHELQIEAVPYSEVLTLDD